MKNMPPPNSRSKNASKVVVPTETILSPIHTRTVQEALKVAATDEHTIRVVSDKALDDAERRLRPKGSSPEKW